MNNNYNTNAAASYKAFEAADYAYNHALDTWTDRTINWFDHRRVLENKRLEAAKAILPMEGKGCTIYYYSDHRAATIVKVELTKKGTPKAVEVAFNKVRCIDYYAGTYEILPELESDRGARRFTLRRNGNWYEDGQETSRNSVQLILTHQSHYIDPSF